MGRSVVESFRSEAVAKYIRTYTAADARVLSPHSNAMTLATGRPNASGFMSFVHLSPSTGPEYRDAINYLEPAVLGRLNTAYVHATDAWVAELPGRAQRWLSDGRFFQLLIRDGPDALYRVRSSFLNQDVTPSPESFDGLRRSVPGTASVYLSTETHPLDALRAAAALSHANLLGTAPTAHLHPLTRLPTSPLGSSVPDLVVAPTMVLPDGGGPIWWSEGVAVYAPSGDVVPLVPLPKRPETSVEISDVHQSGEVVAFSATYTNRESEHWTSQDWVVLNADASVWVVLRSLEGDQGTPWYAGQFNPSTDVATFAYEFNALAGDLRVRRADGTLSAVPASVRALDFGTWRLVMRLRDATGRVHLVPLLTFEILADGGVRYEIDGMALRASPGS